MNVIKLKAVFDYLLASIFVGVILGVCGAFAAQGFRSGIVFISNHLRSFFSDDPNFFFYFTTLTLALVFVHYSRLIINGRPFESVADSIYLAHKANNETSKRMKNKEIGHSQSGWINIFDEDNNLKKNWIDLINENPRRFVLALDNVFDGHWLRGYATRVFIWRKALSSLDKQAALIIACGNANDYFKLDIKCLEKRS